MLRPSPGRLLLLLPTATYRATAFVEAARRLGVELTVASELPSTFEQVQPAGLVTLDFSDPERAAQQAAEFARRHPIAGVIGVDDDGAVVAAAIAERLALKGNPPAAALAARDKHLQRRELARHGVPVPRFELHNVDEDVTQLAARVHYPCVLKPLRLAASRGVIRADDAPGFGAALERLRAMADRARGAPDRGAVQCGTPVYGRGSGKGKRAGVARRADHSARTGDAAPGARAGGACRGGHDDPGPGSGGAARGAGDRRGAGRAPRRRRGDHGTPGRGARALARGVALPGVHLCAGRNAGGSRAGAARRPRPPHVRFGVEARPRWPRTRASCAARCGSPSRPWRAAILPGAPSSLPRAAPPAARLR